MSHAPSYLSRKVSTAGRCGETAARLLGPDGPEPEHPPLEEDDVDGGRDGRARPSRGARSPLPAWSDLSYRGQGDSPPFSFSPRLSRASPASWRPAPDRATRRCPSAPAGGCPRTRRELLLPLESQVEVVDRDRRRPQPDRGQQRLELGDERCLPAALRRLDPHHQGRGRRGPRARDLPAFLSSSWARTQKKTGR